MSTALVIHDVRADITLVDVLKIPEGILIEVVAGSENDHLCIAVHQFRKDPVDKVKPFLIGQAGNQPDHELAVVDNQPEGLLKGFLVCPLVPEYIGKIVVFSEQRIRRGIPHFRINPVDNAAQLPGVVTQMRIKPFPIELRLDFTGIGIADGCDHIRIGKAALHHIGILNARLEHIDIEDIIRQACPVLDGRDVVYALEAEIVNCEHRLCGSKLRVGKERAEINRHKGCLPVMAVDDIRHPVHVIQCCQCRFGEIAELGDIVNQVGIRIPG